MNNKISMPSSDAKGVISFGLGVIFVVFILIGGWMSYAPLAASSVAIGKVSAGLNKKTVQHLEGGIIEAIYVKDGDSVEKGQELIKLKDVQIKAQLDILQSQYADALGFYARVKAQKENNNSIVFSDELKDKNIIKDQISIFEATKKNIEDEKKISLQRIEQLGNQINGLNSLIKSKKNRMVSIDEEIVEWDSLYQQKLVDKQRIRELTREKNMLDGDLASTSSEISKIKEQINEIQTQQILRENEFKNETLNQFLEVKSQLSDLKSKIIATQDTLTRTKVLSPIDGVVVGLDFNTIGGVVSPANTLLEIIPQNSKLLVIAQVQTTDIDKVKVGLLADIRFSAFNLNQAHVVEGKVIHVSADNFIDEVTGTPYYEAKVEVTSKGLEQLKDYNFKLVSGMPAEVMIRIGTRTPLSYFVKPFRDMLSRGFNEE
ncbi:MAG: HlyD family type I secretion periplasmic adaptor subunit [Campylobacterota bacterium]|nr:HlyD family type I secretion periplasmic adaptor subunit [Campylobacterota bacterium]